MFCSTRTLPSSRWGYSYLVDPASSHMLVSKIKPCMSKYKLFYGETADGIKTVIVSLMVPLLHG